MQSTKLNLVNKICTICLITFLCPFILNAQIVKGWTKVEADLNRQETLIREQKKIIQMQISHKNKTTKSSEKQAAVKALIEAQSTLRAEIKKYNEIREKALYRYPEKGDKTKRRYLPMRVQSLEQMESEVGLESELTRVKAVVDKKYKKYNKKDDKILIQQASEELKMKKKRESKKGYKKQEKIKMSK